jgi:hypothetical protein
MRCRSKILTDQWGTSEMTTLNKQAYLAGIIDGEGTIGIYRCKQKNGRHQWCYRLFLLVAGTDPILAQWLKENFEAKISWVTGSYYSKNGWKTPFRAAWTTKKAKKLIIELLPFLLVKKQQAVLSLQFPTNYEQCPELRESLYFKMKELNRRGCAVAETECENAVNSGDATVRTERKNNFQRIDENQFRLSLDLN